MSSPGQKAYDESRGESLAGSPGRSGIRRRDVRVEAEPVRGIEAPLELLQSSPRFRRVCRRHTRRRLVELGVVEVAAASERERRDAVGEPTCPGNLRLVVGGVAPD